MNRIVAVSIIAFYAVGLLCLSANASTTYSIAPAGVSAQAGSVGDSFDVLFTNNGPGALSVAAFSFEVTVADPDITLTGADFSTAAPYIFAGNSFDQINSFPLNFVNVDGPSPQILDALDVTNDATGVTIAAGASADLGRILFNVANPAASGPFAVSFSGEVTTIANANNLSTPDGTGISVDSFSGGTISVSPAPEPSSMVLVAVAGTVVASFRRRGVGDRI